MMCEHVSCGSSEKVWLPYRYKGRDRGLKAHTYCVKCGIVKSISPDKPRDIGYFINLVSAIGRSFKVTKIQMRMIAMDLSNSCLADTYGLDRSMQELLFIQIIKKYINLPDNSLKEFLQ